MLHQLKKDLSLSRRKLLIDLAVLLVVFLIGAGVALLIAAMGEEYASIGTLLSGLVLLAVGYFGAAISYPQEFMLALSMGRTRKSFMGAYYLRFVLRLLLSWVVLLVFNRMELALLRAWFPRLTEVPLSFLTDWRFVVPVALLFPVLPMCMGALYGRYGKKGYAAFYFVWLFLCFVLPRMFTKERGDGVLDRMATGVLLVIDVLPLAAWLTIGAAAFAGMAGVVIHLGMRQMVK